MNEEESQGMYFSHHCTTVLAYLYRMEGKGFVSHVKYLVIFAKIYMGNTNRNESPQGLTHISYRLSRPEY
jgi:hypothetical protein